MTARRPCLALLAACAGVLAVPAASATVYTVGAGGAYAHLQDAIDAAVPHPGDDEVRVHTGVYTEGFVVPTTMTAAALDISGGWADGFAAKAPGGTLNTLLVPPPGTRGAWLQPLGGTLTVRELHFFDASTTTPGAGLLVQPQNGAAVLIVGNLIEGSVVTSSSYAAGAAIAVDAQGSGEVDLLDNSIFDSHALIAVGGTGTVYGAAVDVSCGGSTHCVVAGNDIRQTEAAARGGVVWGGAVRLFLRSAVQAQFDRNRIAAVTVGPDAIQTRGRSLYVDAAGQAAVLSGSNRFLAGWPVGGSGALDEVRWNLGDQANLVFSDSLVAQSPLTGVKVVLGGSASADLTNLTVVDNAAGVLVVSGSSQSAHLSNSLVSNAFAAGDFQGTVFSHNGFGLSLPFLAPALYDYSLRRFEPAVHDAGDDAPPGGLGYGDIDSRNRVLGPHVDLGAWETSDRIFADRVDG